MDARKVTLAIVDISGYTQFIHSHRLSEIHAEEIVFELLEAIIDQAAHPLTLNKLEGDAAFLFAEMSDDNQTEVARDVVHQVKEFFKVFYDRVIVLSKERAGCDCDGCRHIFDLKLKAILHSGEAVFKKIRQYEEMAGEDVIMVHHLVKNFIPSNEYILMTESFHQLVGDVDGFPSEVRKETYEGLGDIPVHVTYLNRKNEIESSSPVYFQFF